MKYNFDDKKKICWHTFFAGQAIRKRQSFKTITMRLMDYRGDNGNKLIRLLYPLEGFG